MRFEMDSANTGTGKETYTQSCKGSRNVISGGRDGNDPGIQASKLWRCRLSTMLLPHHRHHHRAAVIITKAFHSPDCWSLFSVFFFFRWKMMPSWAKNCCRTQIKCWSSFKYAAKISVCPSLCLSVRLVCPQQRQGNSFVYPVSIFIWRLFCCFEASLAVFILMMPANAAYVQ